MSADEAEFYLSRSVESLRTLRLRKEKRLARASIMVMVSALVAFAAPVDETVSLVLLPIKLDPSIVSALLLLIGVSLALLSIVDRIAVGLSDREIERLHQERFKTNKPPARCGLPLSSIDTANFVAESRLKSKMVRNGFIAAVFIPFMGVLIHGGMNYRSIPFFAIGIYAFAVLLCVIGSLILFRVESHLGLESPASGE